MKPLRVGILLTSAFGLAAGGQRLWAGARLEANALSGDGGYRERSFSAAVRLPWETPDGRNGPEPISRFGFRGARTVYGLEDAPETRTTEIGGGLEFFERASLDLGFWNTPATSDQPGAYQANGWNGSFSVWGPGWFPNLRFDRPNKDGLLDSSISLSWGKTDHEERFERVMRRGRQNYWAVLEERYAGLSLTETFWGITSLSLNGETHSYEQDIERLAQRLEFLSLNNVSAANTLELLQGFADKSWGVGFVQVLRSWGDLSLSWQRTTYIIGISPRSDRAKLQTTGYIGPYFSVTGTYEQFKPKGQEKTNYAGFGVGVSF
ncbi:MAG: hypothetical protein HY548_01730 [Elusimicrobia bacterium]|nr:hypothetical protein [Elusimicrobiota bacterium]